MSSSCFMSPSNRKKSLCVLFVTPLPSFSLQATVTTTNWPRQNRTCQPQARNGRFSHDIRRTSFIRYLGKNRQGADEPYHKTGGFSAADECQNTTFSNEEGKPSKTRSRQPPSMLSTDPGPNKTRRSSSSLPSNATAKKFEFPDLDHWPWCYEIDNPMMMERDKKDRKYPPGKLPFALELDFVLNHPIADAIIALLVSLNCLIFALQTIDVAPALHDAFFAYEKNLTILFVMEYFGRWYGKGLSPRYLFSRGMLVDFIAVAPYGFAAVSDQTEALFVRILRLSRILRIQRVVMDTDRSAEMMGSLSNLQVRLASVGLSLFSLLYVSAGLFYQVEKDVNPNVLNFFDAFYYSTITLFTVGFGDVTALTSWGRTSKLKR